MVVTEKNTSTEGSEGIYGNYVLHAPFFCKPKTALKKTRKKL